LKTNFLSGLKRIFIRLVFNKQAGRQAMSIIIRVFVVAFCAYAGSVFAGIQFPDLPDPHEMAQK
jgi:hypothetical protein